MSWPIVFLIALVVGVALFGIGTAIVRFGTESITWVLEISPDNESADEGMRLELVARLVIVDTPWATSVLERASREDPDPNVRKAAVRRVANSDAEI